ncbi:MAG: helicase C-terminal domain-containing protein, partial [Bacillota bacterium]|nr:helicase C-terminal domain-containing protein [Bacillota bacterium]
QGFGRLIRTASDFGVAVVLDDRVTTKRYGSQFLRSLPVSWEAASLSAVAVRLSKFLRENGEKGTSPDQDQ